MRPEVNLGWTRYVLVAAGAVCSFFVLFIEWPAGEDTLIPRSPMGKLEPIGRAGDFIFLCGFGLMAFGGTLSGRWRVGRALVQLGLCAAFSMSVAALTLGLKLSEPGPYGSRLLTLIAVSAAIALGFSVWGFHLVRASGYQTESEPRDPPPTS